MQEIFEKIIEKLEERKQLHNRMVDYENKNGTVYEEFQQRKAVEVLNYAIGIVKQEAEKCKSIYMDGEYCWQSCWCTDRCGECRRLCNGDIDYYESYDAINDGWIPSSESFPYESGYYLVTYHEWSNGDYLPKFDDTYVRRLHYQRSEHFVGWNYPHCVDERAEADTNREVIAWRKLPSPYQPKGE